MRKIWILVILFMPWQGWAAIPATPVMTLYQFNGDLKIPYYRIDAFQRSGASSPAGTLWQGTSLIPCLVIRNGRPLTDRKGTPYVGFEVVVNARTATRASTDIFKRAVKERQAMSVANHHCDASVKYVIGVRKLFALDKAPFFSPARLAGARKVVTRARGELDQIIRHFHNAPACEAANARLVGRRAALQRAWDQFIRNNQRRWSGRALRQAKHLDYTMRTAIFEGHLDRGCNAYGACERNIVALSIRNRARESCARHQGCRAVGDFQGVASKVSQYNIWDEYLTQISGLTSCFLREDLAADTGANADYYLKLQRMYAQNLADFQRILFGNDQDLRSIFANTSLRDVKNLRHYYHAPAMGKCFPHHDRIEYMSGAVARKGNDFALIANTRIRVDRKVPGGYLFRDFVLRQEPQRDVVELVNRYPGFVVDGRKVKLRRAARCYPYGIPRGCGFREIGRYRKTPPWLQAGKPLELTCSVQDRGEKCRGGGTPKTVSVGGTCDTQMRPVAHVR